MLMYLVVSFNRFLKERDENSFNYVSEYKCVTCAHTVNLSSCVNFRLSKEILGLLSNKNY